MINSESSDNGVAKTGVTPGKLLAIVFLSITLVVILIVQYSGSETEPTISLIRPETQPVSSTKAGQANSSKTEDSAIDPSVKAFHRWPKVLRHQAQAFNPFVMKRHLGNSVEQTEPRGNPTEQQNTEAYAELDQEPGTTIEQHRAARRQALDELLNSRVGMLVVSGSNSRALINNHLIRVGDVIDGFVVTEIRADGVLFIDQQLEPEELNR